MSLALVSRRAALLAPWNRNELWRRARAVPSLDLRFAENKSLVDATTGAQLVTFTRASRATYVDSEGVIRPAVTNLLLRSEEFDNASWTKTASSVTANAIAAPTGPITADALIESATTEDHFCFQVVSGLATGGTFTYSFNAKANTRSRVMILIAQGSNNAFAIADFLTGTISTPTISGGVWTNASVTIAAVGAGWLRLTITATIVGSSALSCRAVLVDNSNNTTYTGDGTSGIFIWGAQLEQSSTVGEYIPTTSTINSAPRFDHNPVTGESLGLLVEEARTNSIRNNTMVGAVAGTPGTLPTNWVNVATAGLTLEVVGAGIQSGINYIDIKYTGTTANANNVAISFDGPTSIAASSGQAWTGSSYVALIGGSFTNITSSVLRVIERNSGGGFVGQTDVSIATATNSLLNRFAATRTLGGTAAFVQYGFLLTIPSGVAIDITLRIGLPQLELGAFATSVIPTTTAAATRSADVASISGSNYSSWANQASGTIYAEHTTSAFLAAACLLSFDDTTAAERIQHRIAAVGSANIACIDNNSQNVNAFSVLAGSLNALIKSSSSYAADDFAVCLNGGGLGTDTSASLPTTTQATIGFGVGSANVNARIARLTYWPARLGNEVLQRITQ